MKTGKKLLTGSLLALCAALLVLCIVLAAGWSKAAKIDTALPEVRNNGTAIQWKYSDEADWHDLVSLTELRGAAGEAGKDGANGKDGINAKSIEVQRAATHIQWRYAGDEWQNLVAIVDITGPAGQSGKGGANGKTPEIRVNENTLQWRYTGDEIWLNLYDLSVLKGLDGKDGTDGATGKDGKTPFIGENGNWWIGETDTGVKAAGIDGEKGDKGDPGADGAPGKDGVQGPAGADGTPGQDGTTFTPSVSAAGVLSWTNDGGKQNPASVSIRGPAGAAGKDPEPFYVNCTIVGPNMYDENVTHDKTYAQILTAHQAGRPCYVVVDSSDSDKIYLPLTRLVEGNDAMAIFSLAQMVTGDAPEELQVFYVLISPYYAEGFRGSRYTVAINTQSLPAVSTSDNGKFLQVVKGAWTAVTIPDAEGGSY